MPVPLLAEGFGRGLGDIPYAWTIIKAVPWIGLIYLLKIYFSGAKCQAERLMHGKVVMVTVRGPHFSRSLLIRTIGRHVRCWC